MAERGSHSIHSLLQKLQWSNHSLPQPLVCLSQVETDQAHILPSTPSAVGGYCAALRRFILMHMSITREVFMLCDSITTWLSHKPATESDMKGHIVRLNTHEYPCFSLHLQQKSMSQGQKTRLLSSLWRRTGQYGSDGSCLGPHTGRHPSK